MNEEIISFGDFLKEKEENKNRLNSSATKVDTTIDIKEEKEKNNNLDSTIIFEDKKEEKPIDSIKEEISNEENLKEEDISENYIEDVKEQNFSQTNNNYKLYKDKSENFTCEIEIEGADIDNTQVRMIIETKEWNLVFNGDIDKNGKINIPIKKLSLFDEGTVGKIRMEVIADGTVFIPWEDNFEVKMSKRVMVKFNESNKRTTTTTLNDKPSIKFKMK